MAGAAALGGLRKALRIVGQMGIGVSRGTHLPDEQCQRKNAGDPLETTREQNECLRLMEEYPPTKFRRQWGPLNPH